MAKILLIEDDQSLARQVARWLELEHHTVEHAGNGQIGLELLQTYSYDVVVLDVNLPRLNGYQVCKQYRDGGGQATILMLTGRGEMADKESGFDAGVDDYLTKLFNMKELGLRIRALLRRSRSTADDILTAGPLSLDTVGHSVSRNGETIHLQPLEFDLLEFLMRHKGHVYSADALLSSVWKSESETSQESIRTTIKKLRQKIDVKGEPSLITNVHGVGYKID